MSKGIKRSLLGLIGLFVFATVFVPSTLLAAISAPRSIAVASGASHDIALMEDGSIWSWGQNREGQLGDGTEVNKNTPTQIGTDTDWQAIAAGSYHSIAIKTDGSLWAWGYNGNGQLGDGTNRNKNTPAQIGIDTDWQAISAGGEHTIAIKIDGSLWAWGANWFGQLGDGTEVNKNTPAQIGIDTDWQAISAGEDHTIAIKTDGSLWAWGDNGNGELGDGTSVSKNTPTRIGIDTDWQAISAGGEHTIAIKTDGSLWAWGDNRFGQLGDGTNGSKFTPTRIGTDTDWQAIVASAMQHTIAIKTDGSLWAWGHNWYGQLGDGTSVSKNTPTRIGIDTDWQAISAGSHHTIAIKIDGSLWSWGQNVEGYNPMPVQITIVPDDIPPSARSIAAAAGGEHTIVIKTDGSLWAWGNNGLGQLGDGTNVNKNTPVQIGMDIDWQVISAGWNHTIAIKVDGSLWAWGNNGYGQLGDGTEGGKKNTPVRIGMNTDWQAISAGSFHTMAIKIDGSLWAWGNNTYGQLGDGTEGGKKNTPVRIGMDTDWQAISAGGFHTIAIKTNGSLWAWGSNGAAGRLGDAPTQIGMDTDWQAISAGWFYTIAIKTDGSLWAWGDNSDGLLGDGTNVSKNTPAQIGMDTDWQAISASRNHTIAIKTDGSLWAWGDNTYGQLGDGTNVNKNTPTQIGMDTDWQAISANDYHTIAIKTDGSLWAWGDNTYGQLGDGTNVDKNTPTQIINVTPPLAITDLAAGTISDTSIQLTWTAPGDNGDTGTASSYDIRYSTAPITDVNWDTATQTSGEPAPQASGTPQTFTVTGLACDITYHFAIKTSDEVPNTSGLSNVTSAATSVCDTTSPASITDLAAGTITDTFIQLTWTTPGDDGITGTATSYDIRYSTAPITDANWDTATQAAGEPAPQTSGTPQTFTVTGLTCDTTYHFAMKTSDEVPNTSGLSNVPSAATGECPIVDENFETGDFSQYPWMTGGDATWSVTMVNPYMGSYSAEAPMSIGDSQASYLEVTLDVLAGDITFFRSVSSELDYDFLEFRIDGVLQNAWSGTVAWGMESFPVTAGSHTFRWEYTKDVSVSSGSDTAWIDDIYFPPSTDTTSPSAVTDLTTGTVTITTVQLTWIAPGDDGTTGTAASYDIRYSTTPITDANWDTAAQTAGEPAPQTAGTSHIFTVTGLTCDTTYHFAMKTSDEVPNTSELSNIPSAATGECPPPPTPEIRIEPASPLSFGNVTEGNSKDMTFTIYNDGDAQLDITEISADSDQFSIESPASTSLTIDPAGSETITIKFSPTSIGTKTGQVTVTSNDEDEEQFIVSLTGNGISILEGNISTINVPATENRVDGYDLHTFEKAFGSQQEDPNWNPFADLNEDGIVDGSDLAILGSNFGKIEL